MYKRYVTLEEVIFEKPLIDIVCNPKVFIYALFMFFKDTLRPLCRIFGHNMVDKGYNSFYVVTYKECTRCDAAKVLRADGNWKSIYKDKSLLSTNVDSILYDDDDDDDF